MSTVESLQACMKQEDALITEFAAIPEAETEVLVGPETSTRCMTSPSARAASPTNWWN